MNILMKFVMYIWVEYLEDFFSNQLFEYMADHINIKFRELSCLCLKILYHKASFHVHWTGCNKYQACIALFAISMFESHYDF